MPFLGKASIFGLCLASLTSTIAMSQSAQESPANIDLAPTSYSDIAMRNMRRSIGLAVGVSEAYSSSSTISGETSYPALRFSSVQPSLFFRDHRVKSDLSMVYSVNFGRYDGNGSGSTTAHS